MATKKTAKKTATAKSAANKPAASKPAAAKSTTTTVVRRSSASADKPKVFKRKKLNTKLPSNTINIVLAEAIGTFILALVALFAVASSTLPLYVGLALVLLVMVIGNISGAHVNPAVTFGLWSARKLQTVMVPFYWAAQLLGGVGAVVLVNAISGGKFTVLFDNFMTFSGSVFTLELVGTAIFLFGLTAVVTRPDLRPSGKALGVGLSLAVALVVTSVLLPHVKQSAFAKFQEENQSSEQQETKEGERSYPREIYIGGATLNPAVAIAATELTDSQLQGSPTAQETEKTISRFGLETILATLVGAAVGANLYLLIGYRAKVERVERVEA